MPTTAPVRPPSQDLSRAKPARRHDLDLLRVVAALMVVMGHTNAHVFLHAELGSATWAIANTVGYMLLGHWLNQCRFGSATRVWAPTAFVVATAVAVGVNHWYCVSVLGRADELLYGYFSPLTVAQAAALFCLTLSWRAWNPDPRAVRVLGEVSACTLGVYLMHPFGLAVLKELGVTTELFGPVLGVPAVAVIIYVICCAASWVARRNPLARRLV